MAQNFNILQLSMALLLPMSLLQWMETLVSVRRIEALLLLGTKNIYDSVIDWCCLSTLLGTFSFAQLFCAVFIVLNES